MLAQKWEAAQAGKAERKQRSPAKPCAQGYGSNTAGSSKGSWACVSESRDPEVALGVSCDPVIWIKFINKCQNALRSQRLR